MTSSPSVEILARAIHEDYVSRKSAGASDAGSDGSLLPWDYLPESLRESNRDQARSIDGKLHAVGYEAVALPTSSALIVEFTDEQIEVLARMEHERWVEDRVGEGWTQARERDVANKRTPYLVPWEDLSERARDLDRETVRGIPRFLAEAGFGIVPRP